MSYKSPSLEAVRPWRDSVVRLFDVRSFVQSRQRLFEARTLSATMTTAKLPAFDAPASEWLVYADALQEQRDPRGELITLLNANKPVDDFVKKNAPGLFGTAAQWSDRYRVTWHHCLADKVDIVLRASDPQEEIVKGFLNAPVASHVRTIRLVGDSTDKKQVDLAKAMEVLAASLPASCTSVGFIDERATKSSMIVSRDFEPDQVLVTFGSFEPFWAAKNVENVEIDMADITDLELGAVKAPNLKGIAIRSLRYAESYGDPPEISAALANCSWPKLEDFELRLPEQFMANVPLEENPYLPVYSESEDGEDDRYDEAEEGENEGTNWAQLAPLLQSLKKCPLKRLALTGCDSASSLLKVIADTGLPPTLKELDLTGCSLSSDSVAWFEENKPMIEKLERIVVEKTPLSSDDAGRLSKLGPKVSWSNGPGAVHRFVVGME